MAVARAPQGSPLLSLPRELRDQICHNCFHSTCFRIEHTDFFTVLSYDGATAAVRGWPRWLLTNKQLLCEGFEQFYRQATGIECEQRAAQTDLKKSRPRRDTKDSIALQTCLGPSVFSNLHRVRAVDLNDIQLRYYTKYMPLGRPPATLYISSLHTILPLRRWLDMHRDSLKCLKLTFRRPRLLVYMPFEEDWEIEMSQLKGLAQVDQVEFAIHDAGQGIVVVEHLDTVASAMVRMKKELRRTASALVSYDGANATVREWEEDKGRREGGLQGSIIDWHIEAVRKRQ